MSRPHVPVVDAEPAARSPEAGHDLVGDHQDAEAATNLDDLGPIVLTRHGGGERGAGHGFGDEGGDRVRAVGLDHPHELIGVPRTAAVRVTGFSQRYS